MMRADAKYVELKTMGTWGKRSDKDEQIIALTAKVNELSKDEKKKFKDNDDKKNQTPKWKYDRSLSKADTLERHGKTYLLVHWTRTQGEANVGGP